MLKRGTARSRQADRILGRLPDDEPEEYQTGAEAYAEDAPLVEDGFPGEHVGEPATYWHEEEQSEQPDEQRWQANEDQWHADDSQHWHVDENGRDLVPAAPQMPVRAQRKGLGKTLARLRGEPDDP